MRLPALAMALATAALLLAACGSPASTPPTSGGSTITVFAASSLTESFTTIGAQFEAANPGTKVVLNFGGSSTLATQIVEGAPADVFASASTKTMDTVVTASKASNPRVFAVNTMAIATPTTSKVSITALADLADPGVTVAVCQKDVPCGAAAQRLFEKNSLSVTPVTQEADVKAVLSKVSLGEVDAGIVYVTDIGAARGSVVGVTIPAEQNVATDYPIAPLTGGAGGAASAFVDYVLSPPAQQVLRDAGFRSP